MRRKGKAEEGLRLLKQATTLDPRNVLLLEQIAASYIKLRQYAEAAEVYDRAVQIKPNDLTIQIFRSYIDWYWHADPARMCQLVKQVRLNTLGSVSDVADNWFQCALSKRDWAAAEQALAALGDNPSGPTTCFNSIANLAKVCLPAPYSTTFVPAGLSLLHASSRSSWCRSRGITDRPFVFWA